MNGQVVRGVDGADPIDVLPIEETSIQRKPFRVGQAVTDSAALDFKPKSV